jgi:predicted MFS family arabinose efflux permease
VLIGGLAVFALLFAMASATHSFLILAYSDRDQVALNVGFYYMANAAGRLLGTVLSGWSYQAGGLTACLGGAAGLLLVAGALSWWLPQPASDIQITPGAVAADD